jgi:hypothetical protein
MNHALKELSSCYDFGSLESGLRALCSGFGPVSRMDVLPMVDAGKREGVRENAIRRNGSTCVHLRLLIAVVRMRTFRLSASVVYAVPVPVSRREARANLLQQCPYFLGKGLHPRFVD